MESINNDTFTKKEVLIVGNEPNKLEIPQSLAERETPILVGCQELFGTKFVVLQFKDQKLGLNYNQAMELSRLIKKNARKLLYK